MNYGVNPKGINEDTMLMSYVIESNQRHSMDKLSQKYLTHDCISYESIVGKGVKQLTFDQIHYYASHYAAEDADITLRLFNKLDSLLAEKPIQKGVPRY